MTEIAIEAAGYIVTEGTKIRGFGATEDQAWDSATAYFRERDILLLDDGQDIPADRPSMWCRKSTLAASKASARVIDACVDMDMHVSVLWLKDKTAVTFNEWHEIQI